MSTGIEKRVQIMMTFDENGDVINGSKEGQKDSRAVGVTWFDEMGERSTKDGKPSTQFVPYSKMNDLQKNIFDKLVQDYIVLKEFKV